MAVLAAIPARMESKRLPGKPLLEVSGKPLVVWTAENASRAGRIDSVVVITDSREIADACTKHEVTSVLFDCDAWCGTVRISEALRRRYFDFFEPDIVLNVQCDEPMVPAEVLDDLLWRMQVWPDTTIGTVIAPIKSASMLADEDTVKADVSYGGECLAFARGGWFCRPMAHCGVYVFRRRTLLAVGKLPQSRASRAHQLEQLTWLDNGYTVQSVEAAALPLSVNSPADFERFKNLAGGLAVA